MFSDMASLLGGVVLLYFGAEWLVSGASGIALSLRIPQLIVGLTVVAYGTSAPEVVVGIQAAAGGHGDVALGNVIGSNIANLGLILGAAILVRPARVDGSMARRELPVLVVSSGLLPLVLLDGTVSRWEAAPLLVAAAIYTIWMVRVARRSNTLAEATAGAAVTADAADAAGGPTPRGRGQLVATAALGLGLLVIGGHLFVDGATAIALTLGMSERLVGLTIVAVGTSLPELATSMVAALRGHSDIAVGNVVGSNIFNVLLCLGTAAAVKPIDADLAVVGVDLAALGGFTLLGVLFMRRARTMPRREGVALIGMYGLFLGYLAVEPLLPW